jgi:mono/diheme cytochrome c family protein
MVLVRVLRIVGMVLGALVLLVVLAVGGVWLNAQRLLGQAHTNPIAVVTVDRSPEQVARGAYLVTAFPGCAGCHASNPAAEPPILDGKPFTEIAALADLYAPNLTPGGPLKEWSDGEIIRAIREGVDRDGHALFLMPSDDYRHLSDADAQAIVAYLRSQPAVTKDGTPRKLTTLGTMLVGAGRFPLSAQAPVSNVTDPPRGPTAAYGQHLVEIGGCRTCHGPALDGENVPQGPPPGPSVHVVKSWTEAQFFGMMRSGRDPFGRPISELMPWRQFGRASDDDLSALYAYLKSLP